MAEKVRAEVIGSLLQPAALVAARGRFAKGEIPAAELHAVEDDAVDFCIAMQEEVGLDVISDGEMRRGSWTAMTRALHGIELRDVIRSYPASVHQEDLTKPAPALTVVEPVAQKAGFDPIADYAYLRQHAQQMTKFTLPAPSYYRRFWSDELSGAAYLDCETFLFAVRDWLQGVVGSLVTQGCPYIQLDAPNYGSLCDEENRQYHASLGHDLREQLAFDGDLDSSVFAGVGPDVVRAIHVCRGNWLDATWSVGGYDVIAEELFPRLDVDAVLLEYDSERAGAFDPLQYVRSGSTAVLGVLTTKSNALESAENVTAKVESATQFKPMAELALSTQCGFSSSGSNNPLTLDDQRDKLGLIATLAHSLWSE
jgi:5-methyltetrahydropteroyltriglutamate--homocysteine methyltransferase